MTWQWLLWPSQAMGTVVEVAVTATLASGYVGSCGATVVVVRAW